MEKIIYEKKAVVDIGEDDMVAFLAFMRYRDLWTTMFSEVPRRVQVTINFDADGNIRSAVIPKIITV